ncbi:MAG TPA: hypothetical protein VII73_08035 [Caulobacteraceae bacterium]
MRKNLLKTAAVGVIVAAGTLVATAASADVACNHYGECWTVKERYTTYPANIGVVFHDDAWRATHKSHYHWRADRPDDHGYYSHGVWTPFAP